MARALLVLALLLFLPSAAAAEDAEGPEEAPGLAALEDEAFDLYFARWKRLVAVVDPMREIAALYCGRNLSPVLGAIVWRHESLPEELRDPAVRRLGLDDAFQVVHLLPGSAAAEAGFEVGDRILEVRGRVPRKLRTIVSPKTREPGEPTPMRILRDGREIDVAVPPRPGCRPAAWFLNHDGMLAGVGHHAIVVTSWMFRFIENDDELGVIVGHELGHVAGSRNGRAAGEAESDYLGAYLAAAAGFDVSVASGFWSRFARRNPVPFSSFSSADDRFRSHPPSSARSLALERAVREIETKRASGAPLVPEGASR